MIINEPYMQIIESPLGPICLRGNESAVCGIEFVNDHHKITDCTPSSLLERCREELDAYFEGKLTRFSFPIHQNGTAFQQAVWKLLLEIPFGKTLSYRDLSLRYGDEKAIRAVAAANGKNSLAIVVPCHRVIGSNQSLTGYAGGLWRKKWLLEHEARYSAGVQTLF